MKTFRFFFIALITIGQICSESIIAQSSDVNYSCNSIARIINGFGNGFSGMYNPSTGYKDSGGSFEYKATVFPDGFNSGTYDLIAEGKAESAFYSVELSGEDEEIEAFIRKIVDCLFDNGFEYIGADEYFDDYMGDGYVDVYTYRSKELEVTLQESWDVYPVFFMIKFEKMK